MGYTESGQSRATQRIPRFACNPALNHAQFLASKRNQLLAAQLLQGVIDVNGRKPGGVSQLGLRKRELATLVLHKPDALHTDEQLAKQVRHPLDSQALSKVNDPLALGRGGDELIPKQSLSSAGMAAHDPD